MSFIVSSSSDNSSSRTFSVSAKNIDTKSKDSVVKIKNAVSQIVSQNKDKELSEVEIDFDTNTYKVGNIEGQIDPSLADKVDVKIISLSSAALPKSQRSVKEIWRELSSMHQDSIRPIQILWSLVLYPLGILKRALEGPRPDPSILKEQNDFKEVMKWGIEALDIKAEDDPNYHLGEEYALANQLKELNSPVDASAIFNRLHRVKDNERPINLCLIDAGHYQDGKYIPAIAAFYKTADGKLAVSIMSYGDESGPTQIDFVWNDFERIEDAKKTINELIVQLKAGNNPSENTVKGHAYFGNQAIGEAELPGTQMASYYRELINKTNAVEIDRPERRAVIRQDPWKMLQETIRMQFPESSLANKTLFSYRLLHDKVQKYVEGEPRLTDEEKRAVIAKLSKDLDSLERQILKGDASLRQVSLQSFENLKQQIGEIKRSLGDKDVGKPDLSRLDKANGEPYVNEVKEIADTSREVKGSTVSGSLDKADVALIKRVRAAADKRDQLEARHEAYLAHKKARLERGFDLNIQRAKPDIEKERTLEPDSTAQSKYIDELKNATQDVSKRINELISEKKYQQAIDLYNSVMHDMPAILNVYEADVWKETRDVFRAELLNMTKGFWEAKVRLRQLPLTIQEKAYLMIAKRLQLQMGDGKAEKAYAKKIDEEDENSFSISRPLDLFDFEGNNSDYKLAKNLRRAFSFSVEEKKVEEPEKIMAALVRSLYHPEKGINPVDVPVNKDNVRNEIQEKIEKADRLDFVLSNDEPYEVVIKANGNTIAGLMPQDSKKNYYFANEVPPPRDPQFAQRFVAEIDQSNGTEGALNLALVFEGEPLPDWQMQVANYRTRNTLDEVFDLVIANPQYLDNTNYLIRFVKIINKASFGAIFGEVPTLDKTYIENSLPLLENLIKEAIENGQIKRAAALSYMISHVYRMSGNNPPAEIDALMKQALLKLDHPNLSPSEKVDAAVFIVSHFANDARGRDLSKIEALNDPKIAGKLLSAIGLLSQGGASASIPFLVTGGIEWARTVFKPYLDAHPDLMQGSLEELGKGQNLRQEESWKPDPENPDLFRQGNSSFDLLNFRWIEVNGKLLSGYATKLPSEITNNPDYKALFKGGAREASLSSTSVSGVFLYKFKENDEEISLYFTPGTGALVIEKEGEQYVGHDTKLGAIFRNKNDPSKGSAKRGSEKFEIAFKGNKIETIKTEEGDIVVNDSKLASALKCVDSNELFFCSDPKNPKKIANIRIPGQNIALLRDKNDWEVVGGPYDRLRWNPDAELNPKLKSSLLDLNMPIEALGIPLFDETTGNTQLLVFPDGKTATRIVFKAEGGIETSATGYLYLAKLYLSQKQYEKAALYMDKARGAREANKQDLELLRKVANDIREIPVTSARSALLKIKSELTVKKVERERTGKTEFGRESFIKDREYLSSIYAQYKRYLEKSPIAVKGEAVEKLEERVYKFGLNGEEIEDFIAYLRPEPDRSVKRANQIEAKEEQFRYFFARMDTKNLKDEEINALLKSNNFDKRLVTHFFEVWNYVISHPNVEIGDAFLYAAAPSKELDIARRLILLARENEAQPYDLDVLNKVHKELPAFSLTKKIKGPAVEMALKGLSEPLLMLETKKEAPKAIDIDKIDLSRLGPDVKAYIQNPDNLSVLKQQKFTSIEQLTKFISDKINLNLSEAARKIELHRSISNLEDKAKIKSADWENKEKVELADYTPFKPSGFKENTGNRITPEEIDHYAANLSVKSESAKNKLRERVEVQDKVVDREKLDSLKQEIVERKSSLDSKAGVLKDSIIEKLLKIEHKEKLPLKLRQLLKAYEKGEKEALFEMILDAYQTNVPLGKEIENEILNYLLLKTESNLLGLPATKILNELAELKKQSGVEEEWNQASFALGRLLKQASKRDRYIVSRELIDPRYSRKFLVAELRNQIILTKEQIDLIKRIDKDPAQWFQLMMGGGKTSTILPIVLLLIADKGTMAVGLLKAKLAQQGLDSLDKSTRLLMERAGILFNFDSKTPRSAIALQEEYLRLLQVREDKGYVITTIESKAAIEHKIMMLRQKIRDDNPQDSEFEEQLHWLIKIRSLLKSGVTMGDEIDDIVNIKQENNLGIGNVTLNSKLCSSMKKVMLLIYRDPELRELRDAILNESQNDLKKEKIEEFKEKIVEKLGGDKSYILGNAPIADGHNVEEETALKKLLVRLPLALSQKPGMQVGIKASDGFTVGPLDRTDEIEGTYFGKEEDVVLNHFILYSAKLPNTPFLKQAWNKFYEKYPDKGRKILKEAKEKGITPIEYLNSDPKFVEERLDLLQTCIIETKSVKRSDKQYVLNHQELVMDEEIGGVSGTLDPYVMPTNKLNKGEDSVQVETALRLKMSKSDKVSYVSEENYFSAMDEHIGKTDCKAIINEGYALKGMNALEVVAKMRETTNGQKRDFVFIHPKSRKMHIWRAGLEVSQEISPQGLQDMLLRDPDLRKNFIAYYAPTDTRGTDIKVPRGYGVLGFSSSTKTASREQAELRLRELGELHSLEFVTSSSDMKDFMSMNKTIEDRTNEDVLGDSLKSVIVHMQSAVSIGVRAMLASDNKAKDKSEYWSNANKDARLKERELEKEITTEAEKYIIRSKATPLGETVTKEYALFDKLRDTIQDEEKKIESLQKFINDMKMKYPEQTERIKQLQESLTNAKVRLAQIKEEYLDKDKVKPEHAAHLPEKISSPESSDSSLEQVNEEQMANVNVQASEMVQETAVSQESEAKEKMPHQRWTEFTPVGKKDPLGGSDYYANEDKDLRDKYGLDFHVTQSFFNLHKRMPKILGEPIGRFMVSGAEIVLISSDNYQFEVIDAMKQGSIAVYTPLNGEKYGQSVKLNRGIANAPPDNEALKKVVQGKWMMGYTQYSEEEKAVLVAWIQNLDAAVLENHRQFVNDKGSIKLKELFDEITA